MSERVLLIDDEEDFLETLAERMRNRGMEVSTCNSSIDALTKVEEGSFDAIVMRRGGYGPPYFRYFIHPAAGG